MDTILIDGTKYEPMVLDEVKDFEPKVIEHAKAIFGRGCEYFPKKKLTTIANNRRIPDGFVVDFEKRKWYVVELKVLCDDAIRRIRDQIDDYRTAIEDIGTRRQIYKAIKQVKNSDFLDELIVDTDPEFIVIINSLDGEKGEQFKEKVNKPNKKAKVIKFSVFVKHSEDDSNEPSKKYAFLYETLDKLTSRLLKSESGKTLVRNRKEGLITTQKRYFIPILGALIDFGGEKRLKDIYPAVEKRMSDVLIKEDYENLPTGGIRWKNAVRFARQATKEKGLLDKNSPTGVWRITDKGRKYYEENELF